MVRKALPIIAIPAILFGHGIGGWQSLDGPPAGRADDMSIGWDDVYNWWNLFACDRTHQLYRSTNLGASWDSIVKDHTDYPTCVVTHKDDGRIVFIGREDPDYIVMKSTNGGSSWEPKDEGITNPSPRCFAMHPENPSIVFLGCGQFGAYRLFKTTNGGELWVGKDIIPGQTDPSVNDISIISTPSEGTKILLASSSKGIYLSTDLGETWECRLADVAIYSVHYANEFLAYAGANEGIYKSTDGGFTWSKLENSPKSACAIRSVTTNTVYAATRSGMYKTTDGGNTWHEINQGIRARDLNSLVIHPDDNQTLFAGGMLSVYKTTNGGNSWSDITKGYKLLKTSSVSAINPYLYSISLPQYNEDYVQTSISTDNGLSWYATQTGNMVQGPCYVKICPNNVQKALAGWFCQYNVYECPEGRSLLSWKFRGGIITSPATND